MYNSFSYYLFLIFKIFHVLNIPIPKTFYTIGVLSNHMTDEVFFTKGLTHTRKFTSKSGMSFPVDVKGKTDFHTVFIL